VTEPTYRLVIPLLRFVGFVTSLTPEVYDFSYREARVPFFIVFVEAPPPGLFNPVLPPLRLTGFFYSNMKLEKSNLFSSSSSCLRFRSSSSFYHRSFRCRSRSWLKSSRATNFGERIFRSCRR